MRIRMISLEKILIKSQLFVGLTGGEDYHKGFLTDSAKESGIDVKWDTLVAADWADKKSVLVASGDLPDAFLGSNAFT